MEDTIVKDVKYYEDNREEATKKAKWCFEKFNLEEEKILEEVKAGKKYPHDIVESLYPEDTKIVDVINRKNCKFATYVYLDDRS